MSTAEAISAIAVAVVLAACSIQVAWQVRRDCKRTDLTGWTEIDHDDDC
jgi:hypothetical protein